MPLPALPTRRYFSLKLIERKTHTTTYPRHLLFPLMASSTYSYYSAATPSEHFPSSSSHIPTRGLPPPPYHVNGAANTLEAFAEVNRALQSRNARQSLPRRVPQGPRAPRALNSEIFPYQPRTLEKEQLPQDASQLYPPFMHAYANQEYNVVNPRFSTASSPAVLYSGSPAFSSSSDRENGRYEEYPRDFASMGHTRPARPTLKLITPSSPQWASVSTTQRQDRTFRDMGYQSRSLKDRSSCIVM
ncbi:hypothetical protein B0J17DRAFT_4237 [Rhizoctonia solani]|nr:hypothetical protein B0J17DRAFT_4237 [Rhizoctonia solani]